MLRVSREETENSGLVLKLEGQIVGEWVDLVARECAAAHQEGGRVVLDLAGVTYADARGLSMLRGLDGRTIRVVNATPLLHEQLTDRGRGS